MSYDATIGRWISEDPTGFASGEFNPVRYVGNAPTFYLDTDGLEGHHIVPQELWDMFGFSDEAKSIFDAATVGTSELGHDFSAHGRVNGYTGHVIAEMNKQLKRFLKECGDKSGKLTIAQQKQFAELFVEHIRKGAGNPFIRQFNDEVNKRGKAGVEKWYETKGYKIDRPARPDKITKIKGIRKIRPPKGTKIWRRIPGARYIFTAAAATLIYNNARADGMAPKQAAALTSIECANPFVLGLQDLYDVMRWADRHYRDVVDGAYDLNRGRASAEKLNRDDIIGKMSRARKRQAELLKEYQDRD